jgi:tetratricopeptide (TPR) repeat protein
VSARAGLLLAVAIATGATMAHASGSGAEVSRRAQAYQLYQQAQMLLMQRADEAAAELLDKAVERDPTSDLLLEAARVHAEIGQLDKASSLVDRSLVARPGWSEALVERGDLAVARLRSGVDPEANGQAALEAYRAAVAADPSSIEATRSLTEICAQSGRIDEAIDSLKALAEHRTLPAPMTMMMARLYLRSGRTDDARPLLEELLRRSPASAEAADLLASVYEDEGRYDDAIALFEPLIEAMPTRASLYQRVGLLHLEAGHAKDAVAALETADRLDPGNPAALLLLVQAYDGADDVDAALSTCNRLLAIQPDNLEARFHHARLLRRNGDTVGARREFQDLILKAGDVKDSKEQDERMETMLTLAWAQVGVLALSTRDWPAAEQALEEAVRRARDPRPDILRLLARAHIEAGHFDTAASVVAGGTTRFPDDLDLKALAGEIRLAQGDASGANTLFHELIESDGGSIEAYISVSEALMRQKRYTETDQILREALRRHADDDRLLFARGAALERLGHGTQAERVLGRAVEVNPKNAMALNYLGYMLADSGRRLDDSLAYVERALALEPDNPAYLDSLGWALFKLARYEPAEEKLRAALRYDGSDPAIREHLGDLLIATGRAEEAVRAWQAALECGHEEPNRVIEKMAKARALIKPAP